MENEMNDVHPDADGQPMDRPAPHDVADMPAPGVGEGSPIVGPDVPRPNQPNVTDEGELTKDESASHIFPINTPHSPPADPAFSVPRDGEVPLI